MKIVAGGQSGVDRGALDGALEAGLLCGGWCPRDRRSETGPIPHRYPLTETETPVYSERTHLNVRDSDATLVIGEGPVAGGTARTLDFVAAMGKPSLTLKPSRGVANACRELLVFLNDNAVEVLNVAGPRASEAPGAGAFTKALIIRLQAVMVRANSQENGNHGSP